MQLILLGAPGSGKGTQAKLIVQQHGWLHLSTGDVLRKNVADGTPLGAKAKPLMESGQYVPDDLINAMVEDQLDRPEGRGGVVFDGYPRTINQAQALDALLERKGRPVQLVLHLEINPEALIARLSGRRVCTGCGAPYHTVSMPPLKEGVCDACGSPLMQRKDDSEETVRTRLEVYQKQTAPLLDYYAAQGKLRAVDAAEGVEKTFEGIQAVLAG
ncbi:MAG TPA: adenylate kinase [Armatimonadota bacterium]